MQYCPFKQKDNGKSLSEAKYTKTKDIRDTYFEFTILMWTHIYRKWHSFLSIVLKHIKGPFLVIYYYINLNQQITKMVYKVYIIRIVEFLTITYIYYTLYT